jgi:hypothetical protein
MRVGGYIIELREGPAKVEQPAAEAKAEAVAFRWAVRFYGVCGLVITAAAVAAAFIGGTA